MADPAAAHVEEISDKPVVEALTKTEREDTGASMGSKDHDSQIVHDEPWRYESWIPGGYSQSRMLRFKDPSTMYMAINLFAGTTDLSENG